MLLLAYDKAGTPIDGKEEVRCRGAGIPVSYIPHCNGLSTAEDYVHIAGWMKHNSTSPALVGTRHTLQRDTLCFSLASESHLKISTFGMGFAAEGAAHTRNQHSLAQGAAALRVRILRNRRSIVIQKEESIRACSHP